MLGTLLWTCCCCCLLLLQHITCFRVGFFSTINSNKIVGKWGLELLTFFFPCSLFSSAMAGFSCYLSSLTLIKYQFVFYVNLVFLIFAVLFRFVSFQPVWKISVPLFDFLWWTSDFVFFFIFRSLLPSNPWINIEFSGAMEMLPKR